ncbi:class II aldolase/adducin family protein [Candidatus Deferrimicrobium sp.]|uniref:class II aldolase/adducin family protein n=1 Tax=Candidatus Deferrimicrobium sp. TaxID=3060586 RepID=UPI002ED17CC8
MRSLIAKFAGKLHRDRSAVQGRVGIAVQDDVMISEGAPDLSRLTVDVLSRLSCLGVVAASPSLPFAEFLLRRANADAEAIVPLDTETRTFLHDIPIVRRAELAGDPAAAIAALLSNRKGVIAEGVGIVASGPVTLEQAYIHYSSVFHACYVKYLLDVLQDGFLLPGEEDAFRDFRKTSLRPLTSEELFFSASHLDDPEEVLAEIRTVGRYTVQRGLVDSFFGNISYRVGETIFISQTAASLDELAGCIDPVPMDNRSTTGITASSELLAHRRIYEATGARAILHGHPKFAVVMSMLCEEKGCPVKDCWKDCPNVRMLGDTPVVAGEIGAGGLAVRVPPVIGAPGKAIVYGHGVFTIGRDGFEEAFRSMVDVESRCREEYFRRLDARAGRQSKSE